MSEKKVKRDAEIGQLVRELVEAMNKHKPPDARGAILWGLTHAIAEGKVLILKDEDDLHFFFVQFLRIAFPKEHAIWN